MAFQVIQAPPMQGCEYLSPDVLLAWWSELDGLVREQIEHHPGGAQAYLSECNPQWRFVGRVTFHLAENKRDPGHPFAFLATYIPKLSAQGRVQHEPLGKALQQYAGAKNRASLISLLLPIQRATERSPLIKDLVDSGEIYHPLAWSPRETYQFLRDIPIFEESGLVVRLPDWWKASRPPRPVVNVKIDSRKGSVLGASALLDFSVDVTLDGEPLSERELREILESVGGLVALKGKWVEVDREKLAEALHHWQAMERETRQSGLSFYEGMRLLAGLPAKQNEAISSGEERDWIGLTAGPALEEALLKLRSPESLGTAVPNGLNAQLRHYQQTGVNWLRFVTGLGLGACLADDMGLGKTVQVIGLLLHRKPQSADRKARQPRASLLVVPASLLANWKAELRRFAPSLSFQIVHPSENPTAKQEAPEPEDRRVDLLITTYGMLTRTDRLRERDWDLVILDEAQAIKNSGTRQSKPAEITMKCSCPDWAGMCKHVAAVMYGVGARLDTSPELLFLLRKVDHLELIAGAVDAAPVAAAGKNKRKKTIAAEDLAGVFGIEMAEAETPAAASPEATTAKKPTKPRVAASKTASKKKPDRGFAASKNAAAAVVQVKQKPKRAAARPGASAGERAKTTARKRLKQDAT